MTYQLTKLSAWQVLQQHYQTIKDSHMRDMFAQDTRRFEKFSIHLDDLLLDYSKNRINETSMKLLLDLARQANIESWRDRMFVGEAINITEGRSVLHIALRNRANTPIRVNGKDVMPAVNAELAHMREFSDQIRSGQWRSYNGRRIRHIVNIGIGGSDLGPHLVCDALQPFAQNDLHMHFVSNVDGAHMHETLKLLQPETTLFIISSKTFTTSETMRNAHTARDWFMRQVRDEKAIARHFVAVTTNVPLANQFGIAGENIFAFWDWVGGRYSLWSAIGLSIAVSIGMDHFEQLLSGAQQMDQHFKNAPLEQNMPVILALLGIWYHNFFGFETHGIMPYSQYLRRLADYLQQLDMESNGKSIDREGQALNYHSGPIIWGQAGTNGQHAFYQLLHQGTRPVPTDFILPMRAEHDLPQHQQLLTANCFAQTRALMLGKTLAQVQQEMKAQGFDDARIATIAPHKLFAGNKPTNTLLFERLTPYALGRLLALYEHKVFVQGIIWNINSFDQWGVEYGKALATEINRDLAEKSESLPHDSSTNGLIHWRNQYYL